MSHRAEAKDLLLPIAVVAAVGMMIFPLPPAVLDFLLMCNIAFALALLINSVYLSEPEKFTALPTILLLATLFRLGLNVSTTRQLLAHGEAPGIVIAFGNFVVSGNLVVGVVIFFIVTLVQFLVIAKGAERVAEVAARFTLDAMPGKQMSIDADVRAGMLSLSEAKQKRIDLQRESKLYGALDGAMKFVKGDAIAGLLITLINISAGLVVGMTQLDLSFSEALKRFTIFTVGDGLVSQIPALLVAVAAGICVTQVGDKAGSFLGREVFSQLGREPQALATSSVLLLTLAFIPGLPFIPFFIGGLMFATGSRYVRRNIVLNEKAKGEGEFRPKVYSGIVLKMSAPATLILRREGTLPMRFKELKSELFTNWGVLIPEAQFDVDSTRTDINISLYLFSEKRAEIHFLKEEDLNEVKLGDLVIKELRLLFSKKLADLIDDTQTRTLLEINQGSIEDLVNSVVSEIISVTELTTILRELVLEGIPINDMRTILQALAEFDLSSKEGSFDKQQRSVVPALKALQSSSENQPTGRKERLAAVRIALGRTISRTLLKDREQISVWTLSAELDHMLAKATYAAMPLIPSLTEEIILQLKESNPEIVLTTQFSRSFLATLVRQVGFDIKVIAIEEITEEVKIDVLGEIGSTLIPEPEEEIIETATVESPPSLMMQ